MAIKRLTDTSAFPIITTVDATLDKIGLIDVSDTTQHATGSTKVATPNQIAAAIKLDDLGAPDDNTDRNATTSAHGLCPKGSGNASQFLNGNLGWTTPAGGATTASELPFVPNGSIASTNVQTAIQEVRDEAAPDSHTSATAAHGATGAVVGTTNAQTLTNKTLTSPVIATIVNTGTLTLPTSTDTLVGRATTDTLTNKKATLAAGSTGAGTAPLKLTSGSVMTTPEAGAVEFDGADFFFTIGSTRYRFGAQLGLNVGALRIVDVGLNTAPGSPAALDAHIIGTSQTGSTAWTSFTAGGLAVRNAANSAWIDYGASRDGWAGKVTSSATHHYAGARVAFDSAVASEFGALEGWHPLCPLYVSTAHYTGSRSRVNNRPIWSLTVTTTGADHTASGTQVAVAHGQTFDWTDASNWVEGNLRASTNQGRKIPQNFASTVFETNVNNTNVLFIYSGQNLTAYTFVGTLFFTK